MLVVMVLVGVAPAKGACVGVGGSGRGHQGEERDHAKSCHFAKRRGGGTGRDGAGRQGRAAQAAEGA